MILNKLEKNLKKLKPWADRAKIDAYRLYDKDIPEFPFLVDIYKDHVVIFDKTEDIDQGKNKDTEIISAVQKLFLMSDEVAQLRIIFKKRERQKGLNQYQKLEHKNEKIIVHENGIPILVNLYDYLDTGLFIDHRPMRYFFMKNSVNKKFLNLFCYTGVVSLMAAIGKAETVSVDLSDKYLDWAQENFKLNNIDTTKHRFVEQDVLQFIEHASGWPDYKHSFDMIFLDPPTFSNSKSMNESFEVERDQLKLILNTLKFLKPEGTLYFSTNKRKFKLNPQIENDYLVKNTSLKTIPQDCHDQKIHQSYEIRFQTENS
jgi:23S rRNA (cytosine1962-C5)-methyltransferase